MKKIMFNDRYGLTEAVLSGRKTQTRRLVPKSIFQSEHDIDEDARKIWIEDMYGDWHDVRKSKYSFKVGEVVAVAQAYRDIAHPNDGFLDERYEVKDEFTAGWSNKMFVRADLMPNRTRITNVRVERLQDISDEDCIKEGVLHSDKYAMPYGIPDSKAPNGVDFYYSTPREAYAALIDKISGKGTWESNPYVFVYDFELVK